MNFDRLRQDSRLRRRIGIGFFGALLLLVAAAAGALIAVTLSSSASLSDRLVEVGDYLAGGTLLLAVIAGLVALLAYASATGLPDLQIRLKFPSGAINEPKVEGRFERDGEIILSSIGYSNPELLIRNKSGFSAKNPAVIIRLDAMDSGITGEWTAIEYGGRAGGGATAIQWDGGPTYSIHGYSTRRLPDPAFHALHHERTQGPPAITVELLAEGGYRRVMTFPFDFIVDGEPQYPRASGKAPPEWL